MEALRASLLQWSLSQVLRGKRWSMQFSMGSPNTLYCTYMHANSLQSCPALCDAMDYSSPGSSVHGIFQARILEWAAVPPPGDPSTPRNESTSLMSPASAGGFFTTSAPCKAFLLHTPAINISEHALLLSLNLFIHLFIIKLNTHTTILIEHVHFKTFT